MLRTSHQRRMVACAALLGWVTFSGCGRIWFETIDSDSSGTGSGGAEGVGGAGADAAIGGRDRADAGAGGSSATGGWGGVGAGVDGGAVATGGVLATGGVAGSVATGGVPAAGGEAGSVAAGGALATGGVAGAVAGAPATGGAAGAAGAGAGTGGAVTGGGVNGTGADGGAGGVEGTGGNPSAAGMAGSSGAAGAPMIEPSPNCTGSGGTVTGLWTMDSGVGDWTAHHEGSATSALEWTDLVGRDAPGALRGRYGLGAAGEVGYFRNWTSLHGDLRGKTITAHVFLESGADLLAAAYALDENWTWSDGGYVSVSAGVWTCVQLQIDAPDSVGAGFDPTTIVDLGVILWGYDDVVVLVDDVWY